LKWVVLGLLFFIVVGMLSSSAFAATVSVSSVHYQDRSGLLLYGFFVTAAGSATMTPTVNTALTQTGAATSFTIASGATKYLWSTQFGATATTISAGNWMLDIWVSDSTAGTDTYVTIYTTTSTGAISTTVQSETGGAPGTTKIQSDVVLTESAATVPAHGYIALALTSSGGTTTIYYGSGQHSNFQVPYKVLTS
jgi:hypothetical protein